MVRVPVSRGHSRGFVASGAVVCSISLPTHVSGSLRGFGASVLIGPRPRGSLAGPPAIAAPSAAMSSYPQGLPGVPSLGFVPGPGFWLPRPPARSAPGSRISRWTSAKRLIAGHDVGLAASIPSPAPGRSRVRPRGFRPVRWLVQPLAPLASPTFWRSPVSAMPARTAGPPRDGLARFATASSPSAHCLPPFPKGPGGWQREHPRGCSRVRALHQRRFPSRSRCLISNCPVGRNPAAPRSVGALPARGRHLRVASLPLRSLSARRGSGSYGSGTSFDPIGRSHAWMALAGRENLAPVIRLSAPGSHIVQASCLVRFAGLLQVRDRHRARLLASVDFACPHDPPCVLIRWNLLNLDALCERTDRKSVV